MATTSTQRRIGLTILAALLVISVGVAWISGQGSSPRETKRSARPDHSAESIPRTAVLARLPDCDLQRLPSVDDEVDATSIVERLPPIDLQRLPRTKHHTPKTPLRRLPPVDDQSAA